MAIALELLPWFSPWRTRQSRPIGIADKRLTTAREHGIDISRVEEFDMRSPPQHLIVADTGNPKAGSKRSLFPHCRLAPDVPILMNLLGSPSS